MYRALAADPATRTDKMVGLRTVANRRVIAPRPAGKRRRRHDDGPAAQQVVRSKSRERATVQLAAAALCTAVTSKAVVLGFPIDSTVQRTGDRQQALDVRCRTTKTC